MTSSGPATRASHRRPSDVGDDSSRHGLTVYGCEQGEALLFCEIADRLGVVPTITEAPVSSLNADLAQGHRCVSVGHKTPVDAATLRALNHAGVTYISTRSIGCNHIDVGHAQSLGMEVENVAYSPDSVADYTLMLMLMGVRHTKSVLNRAAAHDYRLNEAPGRELRDLTVGVIGTGRIGAAVIDRLRGFGCRMLAHDTSPTTDADYVSLDEILRQSDIVTLHTPLTPDTHHLLSGRRIEEMRHGSFLVNTGRGSLIDTQALLSALERGRIGGAALDVVEGEEGIFYADRRDGSLDEVILARLQRLPNVIISPHTAYFTDHALRDAIECSVLNCLKYESTLPRA